MSSSVPPGAEQTARRISQNTFFVRKVFPFLWFGILITVFCGMVAAMLNSGQKAPPVFVLFVPPLMMAFGYVLMRALVFNLVDEVQDMGNFLLVKKGDEEEQVFLSNIVNISYMAARPPRATVTLRQPCRFGSEFAFSPLSPFSDFRKSFRLRNSVVDDLIQRADAARQKAS